MCQENQQSSKPLKSLNCHEFRRVNLQTNNNKKKKNVKALTIRETGLC